MSLVSDIAAAYLGPRKVIRHQLEAGVREERNLMMALLFGLMNFVSQLPTLANKAFQTEHGLASLAAAQFVASVFMMPLILYAIAAIVHAVLKLFGARGTYAEARHVLFWAVLVTVPFVLASGLMSAFAPLNWTLGASALTLLIFSWQWATGLSESEYVRGGRIE